MPLTAEPQFNFIVLSLVLNFVGDSLKRGEMLLRCYKMLHLGGLLFITIPISCINHSLYVDHQKFCEIMSEIGFKEFPEEKQECTSYETAAKLAFYIFRKTKRPNDVPNECTYPFGYRGKIFDTYSQKKLLRENMAEKEDVSNDSGNTKDTRIDFGVDIVYSSNS